MQYSHACVPIPSPYCNMDRSFDFVPRFTLGTSLRMTGRAAWQGVPAALFRERAYYIAQHYSAASYFAAICFCPLHPLRRRYAQIGLCSARAVAALPYSANGRYNIILSIPRTAGVSRSRIPRTGVITLTNPLRGQQYKYTPPLSFRPKRGAERRAKRRNLSHCTHIFAMNIGPHTLIELLSHTPEISRLRTGLSRAPLEMTCEVCPHIN